MVIVLDTLRADMIDRQNVLDSLPTMRRLFGESYVFTRAYAPSHWTLPSHASLFTGLSPSEHMAHPPHLRLGSDFPTIAEKFNDQGYITACFTCNPFLSGRFGMTRGFEIVRSAPTLPSLDSLSSWLFGTATKVLSTNGSGDNGFIHAVRENLKFISQMISSSPLLDNGAREIIREIIHSVRRYRRTPFILVNLMEAHTPYRGRGTLSAWRQRARNLGLLGAWEKIRYAIMGGRLAMTSEMRGRIEEIYWENVRYLDTQIGRLLRKLPGSLLEDGYLILVSDHGQLLGERGLIDHIAGLNESLIHVPLAIRPPGGCAEVVNQPVSVTSLFNLLLAIACGETEPLPSWLEGIRRQELVISESHGAVVPSLHRLVGRTSILMEDILAFKRRHDHPGLACTKGHWRLVCHFGRASDELYDIMRDPDEEVNLANQRIDVLKSLHEQLLSRYSMSRESRRVEIRRDKLGLKGKRKIADAVLADAIENLENPVLVWTGGKDSTLVLYLCLATCQEGGFDPPTLLFIDHGYHFPETHSFTKDIVEREKLQMIVYRNKNLSAAVQNGQNVVSTKALDAENLEEALKAGLEGDEVPLSLETPVGNHLLKTVALNQAIRSYQFDAVISGIRWDESPARSSEVFFSPRETPPHMRVHPILPWTEREVWDYTLENNLPIHPLYTQGYRSFDGVNDSAPTGNEPAWEQDLELEKERAGRAQDKEDTMERLRALGYF